MSKILHFFDVATVASTLAIYQRELGYHADVVSRYVIGGVLDIFPDIKQLNRSIHLDVLNMIRMARKYDILHVHTNFFMAKILKRLYRKKQVILTCHGSEIRNKTVVFPKVDVLTYATPDLVDHVPDYARYIPNTINMNLFARLSDYEKGTIIHMNNGVGHENAEIAAHLNAKMLNLKLSVHDVSFREDGSIRYPYSQMPRILEQYEYYDEVKVDLDGAGQWLKFLSLTALQMLSLGGSVHFYGQHITELPQHHAPAYVINKWNEVYYK